MDIIYILGTGSKWQNNEIRYSIRSILKHCQDLERVIIIGEDPGFYHYNDKLIHIPTADTAHKEANIWKKVLKAAGTPEISDPFLFINDDHFMLKPFNAAVYPYYTKGDLAEMNFNTLRQLSNDIKSHPSGIAKARPADLSFRYPYADVDSQGSIYRSLFSLRRRSHDSTGTGHEKLLRQLLAQAA
jgi:hypothetical protein